MLQPVTVFYIWASLGIFCALTCLVDCEICPLEGLAKPVDYSACRSSIKNSAIGLQNTYSSILGLDYGDGCHKKVPDSDNVCRFSDFFPFSSTLYDLSSKEQCSSRESLDADSRKSGVGLPYLSFRQDGNVSWSSDDFTFNFPDGLTLACFLNIKWTGHERFPSSVSDTDQIILFPDKRHLLYRREAGFSSHNIEIEKSSFSDALSPCLSISPKKLDWEQSYIYHPSVAVLRLENVCNENVIKIYEPFGTDSQFYPFNYSDVVLGPGEVTSISFIFSPKWLGLSSAEVVLPTSLGGFLVQAKGRVIESPNKLVPLLGLNVSSGGWLSLNLNLSLTTLFEEAIHLEEAIAMLSGVGSNEALLAEAICKKQNPQGFHEYCFFDANKGSKDDSEPVIIPIGSLSNWLKNRHSHKTENILKVTFSPYSEGKVLGASCMKWLRPLEGEKETVKGPLTAFVEAVGSCDKSETTISVSVRNNASHLLKVVRITEVGEGKKFLKIKFMEDLLLFPGSVTQVALLSYDTSDVDYDSFAEMAHARMSCGIEIVANDSSNPSLDVPCQDIFGICARTGFLSSTERSSVLTKTMDNSKVDEFVFQRWRDQSTMRGLYLLDDHELDFPLVPIDGYFAKSITVKNPSQQPILVQLILNPSETVNNCKQHVDSHIPSPWSTNLIHHNSTGPTRYGFSMLKNAVTEAFLHPYGTVVLGPIFFHPSNRCEWKSSALIRSNLSGVEQLSLRGVGGLLSLVLLEEANLQYKLHFNMNLPSIEEPTSGCQKPLSKKLIALNSGDFDVRVKKITVSGAACGLDGFLVHNCKEYALMPGESVEIGVSYRTDFSRPVVKRDLELKLASGMLVLPMQASIPIDLFNLCRKSIFRVQVARYCVTMALFAFLMLILFWFILPQMASSDTDDYVTKADRKSIPVVRAKKSGKGTKTGQLKSVQRDKAESVLEYVNAQQGGVKSGITVEHFDCKTADFSDVTVETESVEIERASKEAPTVCLTVRTRKDKRRRARRRSGATAGVMAAHLDVSSSQSGNSTPSSPMSPIITPSPENMRPPSLGEKRSRESSSQRIAESVGPVEVAGNCRAMLLTSATFPGTGRSAPVPPCSYSSRLAISPDARAPGPKMKPQKVVEEEERQILEGRFTYDIWGNHFPGLHLMGRSESDGSLAMMSEYIKGHSGSFFVREPHQTLLTNFVPAPVTVSQSIEDG